nr:MAG TPA: hypothetical protein [Caudoviricetes sp.]
MIFSREYYLKRIFNSSLSYLKIHIHDILR